MLIAVIEMSLSRWLVAGIVPGIERWPPLSRDKQTLCVGLCRAEGTFQAHSRPN
jgi:hypothetical protein